VLWDESPGGFVKERRGEPLSPQPYQAIAVPETLIMVRKDVFRGLGGFRSGACRQSFVGGGLRVQRMAFGYEVYSYPGVAVGTRLECLAIAPKVVRRARRARGCDRAYEHCLEYFTNRARLARYQDRYQSIAALLERNAARIRKSRRDFLRRAKFDEDWLFYKFGYEDHGNGESTGPEERTDRDGAAGQLSG